jgi:hypothetical protein
MGQHAIMPQVNNAILSRYLQIPTEFVATIRPRIKIPMKEVRNPTKWLGARNV